MALDYSQQEMGVDWSFQSPWCGYFKYRRMQRVAFQMMGSIDMPHPGKASRAHTGWESCGCKR